MLFKPKWLRYHNKLFRLYEESTAALIKGEIAPPPPVDILSRVIEKNEELDFFEALDKAHNIKQDFDDGKWREILHDHMLDTRPTISVEEATQNLNHIEERIEADGDKLFWFMCYYVSTQINHEEHGMSPGHYLIKAYLGDIPADKSIRAVLTRARVIAQVKDQEKRGGLT